MELHDSSSDESIVGVPSADMPCSSPEMCATSNNTVYNSLNIKRLLKGQPEKYRLVNNDKINHAKPAPRIDIPMDQRNH